MKRIRTIDYLKTFAIIGVLLFHVGITQNGYLGVEVFFVITGFLMIQGINEDINREGLNRFNIFLKELLAFGR